MKKMLILAVLAMTPLMVLAQESAGGFDGQLSGSIGMTFQSKYIWRGFDVFNDNDPAMQLNANLDLFGTGFGVNVLGHRSLNGGHENSERWDYNLYYANVYLPEDPYQLNYRFGFVHYNYPELPTKLVDLHELHMILSMPNVLGTPGLVPSYGLIKWYPAQSGRVVSHDASGFLHTFMLDYTFAVPGVTPDVPEQVFNLHSEITYNDGVSPATNLTSALPVNTNVDHDWSHAVFGISTDVDMGSGFTLTPGVYYQYSAERTVNTDDEAWVTVGARYSF